jgi:hypothetical protein
MWGSIKCKFCCKEVNTQEELWDRVQRIATEMRTMPEVLQSV